MLNADAFKKIFIVPGGDRVNEEGKPHKTSLENENAILLAIKEIKTALVSDIIKRTGLKNDTISRALFWLKNDKKIEECSTVIIGKRKTPRYRISLK